MIGYLRFIRKAVRKYLRYGSSDFSIKAPRQQSIHVCGNGPSLSESLDLMNHKDDVVMVNFSVLTDLFFKLKPRYLCLADRAFFKKVLDHELEAKKTAMANRLKAVDWEIDLILRSGSDYTLFDVNPRYLSFKFVNTLALDQKITFGRYFLYKYNLATPKIRNVMTLATYIAIQSGYSTIYLHGVDSDSYKGITVDSDNSLVLEDAHFYGKRSLRLKQIDPKRKNDIRLHQALFNQASVFESYHILAGYARHLGVTVLNASPGSMIDAFSRTSIPNSNNKNK